MRPFRALSVGLLPGLLAACGDVGPVAPVAAPPPTSASQMAEPSATLGTLDDAPSGPRADALLIDALTRIVPVLGARGEALTGIFARLHAANGTARATALRDLTEALAAIERRAPADLHPDLAALRLNVEAMRAATDHPIL